MIDQIVYISGPYSSKTIDGIYEHIYNARTIAKYLWKNGIPTICPHLNTQFMDGFIKNPDFIAGDLVLISRCNSLVVLPNYGNSKGTLEEIEFANTMNIPIYYLKSITKKEIKKIVRKIKKNYGSNPEEP